MSTFERVSNICELNGINIRDKDILSEIDSLQYMSIIVSLENEFQIEFPDEVLMRNCLEDLNELCDIIDSLPKLSEERCLEEDNELEDNELEDMLSALDDLEKSRDAIDCAIMQKDDDALCGIIDDFFKKHGKEE